MSQVGLEASSSPSNPGLGNHHPANKQQSRDGLEPGSPWPVPGLPPRQFAKQVLTTLLLREEARHSYCPPSKSSASVGLGPSVTWRSIHQTQNYPYTPGIQGLGLGFHVCKMECPPLQPSSKNENDTRREILKHKAWKCTHTLSLSVYRETSPRVHTLTLTHFDLASCESGRCVRCLRPHEEFTLLGRQ